MSNDNTIKFEGLENILSRLESIENPEGIYKALGKACALVERSAKQKAPKDTGELRRSISSKVDKENLQGIVFTPLEYAPYVEYGTGIHVDPNSGYSGRQTPWLYEDEKTGELIFTRGSHPHPYMRPALEENRAEIIRILKEGITQKND